MLFYLFIYLFVCLSTIPGGITPPPNEQGKNAAFLKRKSSLDGCKKKNYGRTVSPVAVVLAHSPLRLLNEPALIRFFFEKIQTTTFF